jgi:ribosomal protein S18 acetylase RimI-like enzyme
MHLSARKAERRDHGSLVEIERVCFDVARYKWVMSPRAIRHHIDNPKANLQVCCMSSTQYADRVVGYGLALSRANSRSLRFASLAVLPSYQGFGVGEHIINAIETYARQKNFRSIVLEIRQDDLRLLRRYLGLGYVHQKIVANYHPDGGNALRLAKDLAAVIVPREVSWRDADVDCMLHGEDVARGR